MADTDRGIITMRHRTLSHLLLWTAALLITPGLAMPAFSQSPLAIWDLASTGQSGMSPYDVALDHSGHAYVSNLNNYVAHKFTTLGVCVDTLGWTNNGWDFPMHNLRGVGVDSQGRVYIADSGDYRIRVFNSSGAHLFDWPITGNTVGSSGTPYGVAVDDGDTVYVVDQTSDRIQVFTRDGVLVRKWGSAGSGNGQFGTASDVAIDDSGFVYVSDDGSSRIQKFTRMGAFVRGWGSSGTADGQFHRPMGLALDPQGRIYVADYSNHRIQVFDSTGVFITKWGSNGANAGELRGPIGVAVATDGVVYIAEWGNSRVQTFGPVVTAVGGEGRRPALLLDAPSPNPSRGASTLRCGLSRESDATLSICDVQGRVLAVWRWTALAAGSHEVRWNGLAQDGQPVPPGILFARFSADGQVRTQRMVRLR